MYFFKKIAGAVLLAFPLLTAVVPVSAQSSAPQSLRWVVPYPAAGGADFLARSLAGALSDTLGIAVQIDNLPGQALAPASALTQDNAATMVLLDNGRWSIAPLMGIAATEHLNDSFKPVTLIGRMPLILVVNPDSPFTTTQELVQAMKAKPGTFRFGSAGPGTPHHAAMELFNRAAGIEGKHIPSQGASPALINLLSGQTDALMIDPAAAAGMIRAGKVRPLAVANESRLSHLPDLPTLSEQGYPDVKAAALTGVVASVQMSDATVSSLNKTLTHLLEQPEIKRQLQAFGVEPMPGTPDQFLEAFKTDHAYWEALIKKEP